MGVWKYLRKLAGIDPDYIMPDEFHRCGSEMRGEDVQRLPDVFPKAKLLGFSSTAIRYLDNQRDMAEELFDTNIASEMKLGEAIVLGILKSQTYILSVCSYQADLKKYKIGYSARKVKLKTSGANGNRVERLKKIGMGFSSI